GRRIRRGDTGCPPRRERLGSVLRTPRTARQDDERQSGCGGGDESAGHESLRRPGPEVGAGGQHADHATVPACRPPRESIILNLSGTSRPVRGRGASGGVFRARGHERWPSCVRRRTEQGEEPKNLMEPGLSANASVTNVVVLGATGSVGSSA